jgi:hypothetical protein
VSAVGEGNSRGKHYLGLHQGADDARSGYDDVTWQRLAKLRTELDPDQVFLANHKI